MTTPVIFENLHCRSVAVSHLTTFLIRRTGISQEKYPSNVFLVGPSPKAKRKTVGIFEVMSLEDTSL